MTGPADGGGARPEAIFFDLDDTLIFSHGRPRETWMATLRGFEGRFGDRTAVELGEVMMASARWFWSDPARHREGRLDLGQARQTIVGRALAELGLADEALRDAIGEAFEARRWQEMHLLPGSHEAIDALADQGIRLALVTNGASAPQRAKIERFALTERFEHIQIEGEFGLGKPEPAVYRHLLERFGVRPEAAWMVGDNLEWEVHAPRRLGIRGIWCNSTGRPHPPASEVHPDDIVANVTEVVRLIEVG